MAEITVTLHFTQDEGRRLGFDQLELGSTTLLKLWDMRSSPALLWLYLGLLLVPAKHWQARGIVVFGSHDELRSLLLERTLCQRLEDLVTPLYVLLRHLQRVLLQGVSEEVRCEQEAWASIEPEYQRVMSVLPVRSNAYKESEIVQQWQAALTTSLRQALEESDWLPRVQARLALEQYQAELADPPRLAFLLFELARHGLVEPVNQDHVMLIVHELLWETHVQTPPRTGMPPRFLV